MNRILILPGFYFSVAAAILLIPTSWLLAWFTAAIIHELFHIVVVLAMGYHIQTIKIGAFGAVIESDMEGSVRAAICSLAGPIGGLFLLLFVRVIPRVSLCGLLQSIYNLLPILPLDGGRALRNILESVFSREIATRIQRLAHFVWMFMLSLLSVYCFVKLRFGILPVAIVVSLFLTNKKIPCKPMRLPVQ